MAEVGEQAIGYIDAGMRQRRQFPSSLDPRLWSIPPRPQRRLGCTAGAPLRQRRRGIAKRSGDPDVVISLGATAPQRLPFGDEPMHGDANRQGSSRRVAADQRDAELCRQLEEAIEKPVEPRGVGVPHRQRQGRPRRLRAHCGEVGQIDGQRLPAKVEGRRFRREMHAVVERIGGNDQQASGGHAQQRGVIADTEDHIVAIGGSRRTGTNACDQVELTGTVHRVRAADASITRLSGAPPRAMNPVLRVFQNFFDDWNSTARHVAAAWSSTPLTYVWPCSEPKRLVVSIASLMTTRYGTSGRCSISYAAMRNAARSIWSTSSTVQIGR